MITRVGITTLNENIAETDTYGEAIEACEFDFSTQSTLAEISLNSQFVGGNIRVITIRRNVLYLSNP